MVGDLVRVAPGDQVVADGTLERADLLRLDESILTGESRPVEKSTGDGLRSGLVRRRRCGTLLGHGGAARTATPRV